MISRLSGTVAETSPKYAIIDVNGVGYKVFAMSDVLFKLKKGEKTAFFTYLAVREDALDLYGFSSLAELNFFELLITISGIGPKTALGILNLASVNALEKAIHNADASPLIKISGISKKLAEKIVIELKDKIDITKNFETNQNSNDMDVVEALKALGYSQNEARDALKEIPKTIIKTGDKVKEALRILGK